jgi:DNA-binding MarR family transcriptional regulator
VERISPDATGPRDVLRTYLQLLTLGEPFLLELWRSSGITLAQFRVLRAVSRGPCTAGELAEQVGIPRSSLSRMLDRLEQRGLVVRQGDAADRRRVRVDITPTGLEALSRLAPEATESLLRACANLAAEQREAFVRGGQAFAEALRQSQARVGRPPLAEAPAGAEEEGQGEGDEGTTSLRRENRIP